MHLNVCFFYFNGLQLSVHMFQTLTSTAFDHLPGIHALGFQAFGIHEMHLLGSNWLFSNLCLDPPPCLFPSVTPLLHPEANCLTDYIIIIQVANVTDYSISIFEHICYSSEITCLLLKIIKKI